MKKKLQKIKFASNFKYILVGRRAFESQYDGTSRWHMGNEIICMESFFFASFKINTKENYISVQFKLIEQPIYKINLPFNVITKADFSAVVSKTNVKIYIWERLSTADQKSAHQYQFQFYYRNLQFEFHFGIFILEMITSIIFQIWKLYFKNYYIIFSFNQIFFRDKYLVMSNCFLKFIQLTVS